MRMIIERQRITIVPESDEDKAYIEDTLGLKKEGDKISCERIAPAGLEHAIGYLKIQGK